MLTPEMPVQRPTTTRVRRSLFEEAVAIVEREYADDLALDDIARRVATSRRQLQRAYSEVGDTTFREHLTAVRMERAGELLRQGSMTIREVANRVGYRQPAQFAKAFRRHHGSAPSGFRATERRFSRLSEGQQATASAV
jgi:transcriptional regulator GlxA family with amidase domain